MTNDPYEQDTRDRVAAALDILRSGENLLLAQARASTVVETFDFCGLYPWDNPAVIVPLVQCAAAICAGDLALAETWLATVPPVTVAA